MVLILRDVPKSFGFERECSLAEVAQCMAFGSVRRRECTSRKEGKCCVSCGEVIPVVDLPEVDGRFVMIEFVDPPLFQVRFWCLRCDSERV